MKMTSLNLGVIKKATKGGENNKQKGESAQKQSLKAAEPKAAMLLEAVDTPDVPLRLCLSAIERLVWGKSGIILN